MVTLIKRRVEYCYISGYALKAQRKAAGLSQKALADLIKAATGLEIYHQMISRWEDMYEVELEPVMAYMIKEILIKGAK